MTEPCRGDRPQYGLMKRFFGLDGKQALSLEAFQTFIAALRHELTRLEFNYYDYQGRVRGWVGGCVGKWVGGFVGG